ncbi:hypothetical protein BMW23_0804 [Bodo saltans virus]|uniref:Uncharacterized protein n=1 Tax=Bodo saltans virus TaxID=2024608 RepID=A0A2H4UVA4_9VIRU|nr:hypothetical protein QJ851_gp0787 [Bodo saltans virus]ATZ80850.1 hypothetical protein BMW23_0804 [Bodo saltans virus]
MNIPPVMTNMSMQPFRFENMYETKVQLPTGRLNIPSGVNAKITLYDPLTGYVGPTIDAKPNLPQYVNQCDEDIFSLFGCQDRFTNQSLYQSVYQNPYSIYNQSNQSNIVGYRYPQQNNNNNNNTYSGSGVLLLERKYDTKPTVILCKNKQNEYEDMGGGFDSNHVCLRLNAMKELKEESVMLFNIKSCNLNRIVKDSNCYLDIKTPENAYYRSFIVPITGTETTNLSTLFKQNMNIFSRINTKPDYKETIDMTRIYLETILNAVKSNNIKNVTDVNGITCVLSNRVISIFKKMNESPILMTNMFSIVFPAVYQQSIQYPFNGTHMFYI